MKISAFSKILFGVYFGCFSLTGFAADNSDLHWPELACRYELTVTPQAKNQALKSKNSWYFWRKNTLVQTGSADGAYGEIWERTGKGVILYKKLYHADKTAVEYMPADRTIDNSDFNWFKLSSMLSRQELDGLKPLKKTRVLGRKAQWLKGKSAGQNLKVLWLLEEKLPANIVRTDKTSRAELRLVEISPLSSAPRQPVRLEDIADYRHIDAADIGDMENDPFVKKLLASRP